jgi:hypothetical protein
MNLAFPDHQEYFDPTKVRRLELDTVAVSSSEKPPLRRAEDEPRKLTATKTMTKKLTIMSHQKSKNNKGQ